MWPVIFVPTQPIGSWKTAWRNARKAAKVTCRFHDLRHSAVTRLPEAHKRGHSDVGCQKSQLL
jgi:integrase